MFSGKRKSCSFLFFCLFLLLLSGCGNKLQSRFIQAIERNFNQSSASFEISIPEIELDSATMSPKKNNTQDLSLVSLLTPQLNTFRVHGDYTIDFENKNALELNANVDLFGQKIPINFIGNSEKQYFSLNYFLAQNTFSENFAPVNADNRKKVDLDYKKLAGRYINFNDLTTSHEKPTFSTETWALAKEHSQAVQEELATYITQLDNQHFSKHDNTILLTLNRENIEKMVDLYLTISQQPKYQRIFLHIERLTDLKALLKNDLNKLTLTYSIDTKTNIGQIEAFLEPKDSLNTGIKKMTIALTNEPLKFRGTPSLPTDNQIMSKEEFDELTKPNQVTTP